MNGEYLTGVNMEGIVLGQIKLLSQHLPGVTEKKKNKKVSQ
jgi:hypothetical protein